MKILLSGGGSAGHINPAVAIAKYALGEDSKNEVLFVGTKKGLERTLVPQEGFDIKYVNVEGLNTKPTLKNAVSACKMAVAVAKSAAIIKKFKPDVVVGTGGYVCVSSVLAAHMMKIPTLIHEQNVFAGSAVKFLSNKADITAISFDESRKYLKGAKNIILTGNPVRPSIMRQSRADARRALGVGSRKFVVSFGGSLGANRINDVMTEFAKQNQNSDMLIYIASGSRDYDRVLAKMKEENISLNGNVKLLKYIDNMDVVMNAADLAVCRSGAITLAELCAIGKPSVLIPSPNVTNNHQEYNARALSDGGAAVTICEKNFNIQTLTKAVYSVIYDDKKYTEMSQCAKDMGITDATAKIYKAMQEIC